MKRGQVTLFVIIAIIIVAVIAIIAFLPGLTKNPSIIPEQGVTAINSYVQECVESTAEEGIYLLGMQGGYTEIPQAMAFETNLSSVGYSYFEGKKTLPLISQLEDRLSAYVAVMLPKCADFGKWPDFTVTKGEAQTGTTISTNEVIFDVIWLLTIKKGTTTYKLEEYTARFPVRLGLIYNITENIVDRNVANPDLIDISFLIDMDTEYGIKIDVLPYNNTIVYAMTDPQSMLRNKEYLWLFATKF